MKNRTETKESLENQLDCKPVHSKPLSNWQILGMGGSVVVAMGSVFRQVLPRFIDGSLAVSVTSGVVGVILGSLFVVWAFWQRAQCANSVS